MVINCRSVSGSEGGAAAGCSTPCGCVMADDGIKVIGDSYVVNTGEGRRNTVVSGTGTVSNPYTVSFIDSEFFRPEAGDHHVEGLLKISVSKVIAVRVSATRVCPLIIRAILRRGRWKSGSTLLRKNGSAAEPLPPTVEVP